MTQPFFQRQISRIIPLCIIFAISLKCWNEISRPKIKKSRKKGNSNGNGIHFRKRFCILIWFDSWSLDCLLVPKISKRCFFGDFLNSFNWVTQIHRSKNDPKNFFWKYLKNDGRYGHSKFWHSRWRCWFAGWDMTKIFLSI